MRKILNITTIQQALRRLSVAFLITGSGYLQTASAVRWTVDFQKKRGGAYVNASDLAYYTAALNAGESFPLQEIREGVFALTPEWVLAFSTLNLEREKVCFEQSQKAGVIHEELEDDSSEITIVLKNGVLNTREAQRLLEGIKTSFNAEFINCSGTLDLNGDFRKHAKSIRFDNCKFETAQNCFKDTKLLQFFDTTLTVQKNGRFGIAESTKLKFGSNNRLLPFDMPLENALVLEQKGKTLYTQEGNPEKTGKETAQENAGLEERYKKMRAFSQKLLKEKQEQRRTIEELGKQIEKLKVEHKEKVANMQTAHEKDLKGLKEKYERKVNSVKEELKHKDEDIQAKNKRLKELEEYIEGSRNACARAVARIQELEKALEKLKEISSGKNAAPILGDNVNRGVASNPNDNSDVASNPNDNDDAAPNPNDN